MSAVDQSAVTVGRESTPGARPGTGPTTRRIWLRSRAFVQPAIATVVVLAVWEAVVRVNDISAFLMPAPSAIFQTLRDDPSSLLNNLWYTVQESVLGLIAALIVGVLVGAVIAYSAVARRVLYPYLVVLHITPIVAVAPLLAIWFGLGMTTKVVVTFLIAFFSITVGAASGLRAADPDQIMLMRSLNASELQIFWRVRLPAATVPLMAGIRVAAPATVVGAIVAEFVSPNKGLGYLILQAKNSLDTAELFLSIAACAVVGLVFFGLATLAERRLLHWHPTVREESS